MREFVFTKSKRQKVGLAALEALEEATLEAALEHLWDTPRTVRDADMDCVTDTPKTATGTHETDHEDAVADHDDELEKTIEQYIAEFDDTKARNQDEQKGGPTGHGRGGGRCGMHSHAHSQAREHGCYRAYPTTPRRGPSIPSNGGCLVNLATRGAPGILRIVPPGNPAVSSPSAQSVITVPSGGSEGESVGHMRF